LVYNAYNMTAADVEFQVVDLGQFSKETDNCSCPRGVKNLYKFGISDGSFSFNQTSVIAKILVPPNKLEDTMKDLREFFKKKRCTVFGKQKDLVLVNPECESKIQESLTDIQNKHKIVSVPTFFVPEQCENSTSLRSKLEIMESEYRLKEYEIQLKNYEIELKNVEIMLQQKELAMVQQEMSTMCTMDEII
jgi:hypothetical protein